MGPEFMAWARPNYQLALIAGRISFWRCLPAATDRAYSGASSATAPDPLKNDKTTGWLKGELRPPE
jgi:hypothetical protein